MISNKTESRDLNYRERLFAKFNLNTRETETHTYTQKTTNMRINKSHFPSKKL